MYKLNATVEPKLKDLQSNYRIMMNQARNFYEIISIN